MINFSCLVFLWGRCLEFFSSGLLLQVSCGELKRADHVAFPLKGSKMKDEANESVSAGLSYWSLLQHWNQGCLHSTVDKIQYMCNHGFGREELWGKVWQILDITWPFSFPCLDMYRVVMSHSTSKDASYEYIMLKN